MFSGRLGKFREIVIYLIYCFLYLLGNILCMFGIVFLFGSPFFLTMVLDVYGVWETFC